MSAERSVAPWARPSTLALVAVVAGRAALDERGRGTYVAAALVALTYALLDRVLRVSLGDALAAKRVLQVLSAVAISIPTTVALLDPVVRSSPLTAWTSASSAALAIELGVTTASLVTAIPQQLAMPALLLHHALLLLACDYVTRHHFGTAVILTALFQETTNVGWYLHWVLNSPETRHHERWPRLFNINAVLTIAWYALGRFGVVTPVLFYLLWTTPAGAPPMYVGLFAVGLLAQTVMNAQNLVKLARSYPRCPSSWLHASSPAPGIAGS